MRNTAAVKKIASEYGPVTLTMAGIGTTREPFKSLFIIFKKDLKLYEWFYHIGKTKKVEKNRLSSYAPFKPLLPGAGHRNAI